MKTIKVEYTRTKDSARVTFERETEWEVFTAINEAEQRHPYHDFVWEIVDHGNMLDHTMDIPALMASVYAEADKTALQVDVSEAKSATMPTLPPGKYYDAWGNIRINGVFHAGAQCTGNGLPFLKELGNN